MAIIQIKGYQCDRCEHKWPPRSMKDDEEPIICPACKTPYWNRERKNRSKKTKKGGTKK